MEYRLPNFSFPSANATFTVIPSYIQRQRKSAHRRREAVIVPVVVTVALRTSSYQAYAYANYFRKDRQPRKSLSNIAEGKQSTTTQNEFGPATAELPNYLAALPSGYDYSQSTIDEFATTDASVRSVSGCKTAPGSFGFSFVGSSTSLEPFPRLSMCSVDRDDADEDDVEEFWHCRGLDHSDILDSRFTGYAAKI